MLVKILAQLLRATEAACWSKRSKCWIGVITLTIIHYLSLAVIQSAGLPILQNTGQFQVVLLNGCKQDFGNNHLYIQNSCFCDRKTVEEYSNETNKLARRLLQLISESLGLEPSVIEDAIGEPFQNITINYYPPCPQPHLTLGLQVLLIAIIVLLM
jgi:hypothetical protein